MRAGVDHIIVNVNDYRGGEKVLRVADAANRLSARRCPTIRRETDVTTGYFGDHGSLWIRPSDPEFRADTFHRHRVGLCEIAFAAESRQQIDDLATKISTNGGKVTDPPKEYDYLPGYYAVFFTDPDGLKLELVHVPR